MVNLKCPGQEHMACPLDKIDGTISISCIQWRETPRKELITGDYSGFVTVWDFCKRKPVYVFRAHQKAVTALHWIERKQVLLSASVDQSIKAWKFGHIWLAEGHFLNEEGAYKKIKKRKEREEEERLQREEGEK